MRETKKQKMFFFFPKKKNTDEKNTRNFSSIQYEKYIQSKFCMHDKFAKKNTFGTETIWYFVWLITFIKSTSNVCCVRVMATLILRLIDEFIERVENCALLFEIDISVGGGYFR